MGRRRRKQAAVPYPSRGKRAPEPSARWQALSLAVTLGVGLTTLVLYPLWAALLGLGAVTSVLALLPPWQRLRVPFALLGSTLAAGAVAIHAWTHHSDLRRPPVVQAVREWPSDLASASDPAGFFPARLALRCDSAATCGAGRSPTLDALAFGDGGFPQGLPDERRFLVARVVPDPRVHPIDDLQPGRDPLRVVPGQTVEIDGIVDNAATPGDAATATRDARALIALPSGSGKVQEVLGSVSATNADPTAVSDSVTLHSAMPVYLRYEPGTAVANRAGGTYRLPDELVSAYDPRHLDRRELAGHGARIGCSQPDGVIPAGRACAVRFRALFDVRYAATPVDANGVGGLDIAPFEVSGRIRGHGQVPVFWSPDELSLSWLTVRGGTEMFVDCVLSAAHRWYHLADAGPMEDDPDRGFDTGFVPARDVTLVHGSPSNCAV